MNTTLHFRVRAAPGAVPPPNAAIWVGNALQPTMAAVSRINVKSVQEIIADLFADLESLMSRSGGDYVIEMEVRVTPCV